jgi:hypothetical protein
MIEFLLSKAMLAIESMWMLYLILLFSGRVRAPF